MRDCNSTNNRQVEAEGEPVYPTTAGNVPSRHPERARYDKALVHAVLDAALVAHVAFVHDGAARILPMLHVRVGESLYLHGSTGARFNRMAARGDGIELAVEVTLFDGLVLARSVFNHSVNYRSVVVHGRAGIVDDAVEKRQLLDALVERLVPGRTAEARPPTEGELRKTAVLALPLDEVSAKVRTGDPADDEQDLARACWAGVVPLETRWGEPVASADLSPAIGLPPSVERLRSRGLTG